VATALAPDPRAPPGATSRPVGRPQSLNEIIEQQSAIRAAATDRQYLYGVPMPAGPANVALRYRTSGSGGSVPPQSQQTKEAYATLLYTEDFLLGVRVLGESIRESGTSADMVALATRGISEASCDTLRADGWIVHRIDQIDNPAQRPGGGFPKNFFGVYSKLLMWGLTMYDKVIYLDADTIVVRNMDHLFQCPNLCVVVRHSERFNSGVMALRPSDDVLNDMLSKIHTLPSYTGGDQGFLNVYFSEFIDAKTFDPLARDFDPKQFAGSRVNRVGTGYNADMGLMALDGNNFKVDPKSIHVLHYTLGPLKPWDFWSDLIIVPSKLWVGFRRNLPVSPGGYKAGETAADTFTRWVLAPAPAIAVALVVRAFVARHRAQLKHRRRAAPPLRPAPPPGAAVGKLLALAAPLVEGIHEPRGGWSTTVFFQASCVVTCVASMGLSFALMDAVVPRKVVPRLGVFVAWEWVALLSCACLGAFCLGAYRLGHHVKRVDKEISAHLLAGRHPWLPSLWGAATIWAAYAVAFMGCPALGIDAFIPRVVLMLLLVMATFSVMVIAATYLGPRWYFAGRLDGTEARWGGGGPGAPGSRGEDPEGRGLFPPGNGGSDFEGWGGGGHSRRDGL